MIDDQLDTSLPVPPAAPARLALASFIHGGPRGKSEAIRTLALGAASFSSLMALGFYDREGSYVGLDVDQDHVAEARAAAAALGLSHVRFEVVDWGGIERTPGGPFDYILIPDLFARVSDAVRVSILELVAAELAPEGLVYLDYPVAPGSTHRALAREMVWPALAGEDSPRARAERAKVTAAAMRGFIGATEHPYPNLLAQELERLAEAPLVEVAREYLAEAREVFFHRDVMERVERHGLRFVCDAAFNQPEGYVSDALRADLEQQGFRGLDQEQMIDILGHRHARASVLCRVEVPPADPLGPTALDHLYLSSGLAPLSRAVRLDPGVEESFEGPLGQRIGSVDPLLKAALVVLRAEHPHALSFADLMRRAVEELHKTGADGEPSDAQLAGFARDFWALYRRGLTDLHLERPRLPARSGKRLHALARWELQTRTTLTTPLHTLLPLQGFDALLARNLAPDIDDEALLGALIAGIASGEVELSLGGAKITDPVLLEPIARGLLARGLAMLSQWGLLVEAPRP